MNTSIYVLWWIHVCISIGPVPMRTGILELLGRSALHMFIFIVFQVAMLIYIFINSLWLVPYPYIFAIKKKLAILRGAWWPWIGVCVFLWCWTQVATLTIWISSFAKCMFKSFACFSLGLYIFWISICRISFYILHMRPSADIGFIYISWESQFRVGCWQEASVPA